MDYKQGIVELTNNEEVLEKLRGMRAVRKFAHHSETVKNEKNEVLRDDAGAVITKPVFKEGFQTQFNGQFIIFFCGEPRTLPLNVADSLERSHVTHLMTKCMQCKGNGTTPAGICINCRGRKKVIKESEDGEELRYRILKVARRFDAMLFDPVTSRPITEGATEEAEAAVAS